MNHNPYVGPRAFKTGEVLDGREREVRELFELLLAERIVLMYSPSGAGKTSMIQAGLIPALTNEEFQVLPVVRVSSELTPEETKVLSDNGKRPVQIRNRYVLSTLLSLEKNYTDNAIPIPELTSMRLVDYLERRNRNQQMHASPAENGKHELPRVLIFDQFEELLTVDPTDHPAKEAFFDEVGAALRNLDYWALFSMREDYSASLDPFLRRVPTRLATTFRLDLLGEHASRLSIQAPARRMGVRFTDEAATKLIDDLRTVQVQQSDGSMRKQLGLHIEPVQLQVVCKRLWDKLPDKTHDISPDHIKTIGDVDAALSGYYAEEVEAAATEVVSERTIREWFDNYLITEQNIRGQVPQGKYESKGLKNEVIGSLIDAYLVRAEKRLGATWFELAHDRLIDPVKSDNAAWLERNLTDFQRDAVLWQKQGHPDNLLVDGQRLLEGEQWAQEHDAQLTSAERDFLEKCREARAQRKRERDQQARLDFRRRQARRSGRVIAALAILILVAGVLLIAIVVQERKLRRQNQAMVVANQVLQQQKAEIEEQKKRQEQLTTEATVQRDEEIAQESKIREQQLKIVELEARKLVTAVINQNANAGTTQSSDATADNSVARKLLDTKALEKAIQGIVKNPKNGKPGDSQGNKNPSSGPNTSNGKAPP